MTSESKVVPAAVGGALLLALFESAFVLLFAAPSFDGVVERLTFCAIELGALVSVGAAVAACALAFCTATTRASARMSMHLVTALFATPIALLSWALLRGPRVRNLPAHDLIVAAVAIVGIVLLDVTLQAARALAPRLRGRARWAIFGVLVLGAMALHVADEWVLPRLYAPFHRALEVMIFVVAAAAVALASTRRVRGNAVLLIVVALGGLFATRAVLRRARTVATIVLDCAPAGGAMAKVLLRGSAVANQVVTTVDTHDAPLPPGPTLGARDIVLVTIDALRADRLSPRVMPTASALADSGVRFDEAYTQVPHTSFAVATLLTGKFVYSLSALGLDAASHETLAQVMRRERYKTAAFFPPAVFFIDHDRLKPLEESKYGFEYVKYEYLDATHRTDQVIDFFEREHPSHAFVWVHYLEPHEPYDLHEGFTEGTPGAPALTPGLSDAQRRYEGEIRYVDHELARLLAYLRTSRPGALVILCADHGEEFGEHGGRYHGTTLYDEQVRVPLVFAIPGATLLPHRNVPGPVGLVDVAPTVLALLDVPSSAKMRGRDLSGFMGATPVAPHPRPVFAEIDRKKMIVDRTMKLACDLEVGTCALFDRGSDPGEHRDLSSKLVDVTAKLRARLDAFMNDESRFEQKESLPPALAKLLSRGRLGDATVAPELVAALPTLAAGPRHEALQLLATLPAVPGAKVDATHLPEDDALLAIMIDARGGDEAARATLRTRLTTPGISDDFFARGGLATNDVPLMADAIQRIDDRTLVVALATALGQTHDPRGLDALVIALAPVRSRADVATAIGELGDRRAIVPLVRWLPNDPYVMVRAAMVRALGRLAKNPDDKKLVEVALSSLAATEEESSVLRALAEALGTGRHGVVEIGPSVAAHGRQRLLLVPAGTKLDLPIVDGMATLPPSFDRHVPGAITIARPIK